MLKGSFSIQVPLYKSRVYSYLPRLQIITITTAPPDKKLIAGIHGPTTHNPTTNNHMTWQRTTTWPNLKLLYKGWSNKIRIEIFVVFLYIAYKKSTVQNIQEFKLQLHRSLNTVKVLIYLLQNNVNTALWRPRWQVD